MGTGRRKNNLADVQELVKQNTVSIQFTIEGLRSIVGQPKIKYRK